MRKICSILSVILFNSFCFGQSVQLNMVEIENHNLSFLRTEVTQELYEKVMGENPSHFRQSKKLPVENVSWYDAIYFCNKLSILNGKTPVYSVKGETDVKKWNYIPHTNDEIDGKVIQNTNANGYRLPEKSDITIANKDKNYTNTKESLNDISWNRLNSDSRTHPVAQKMPNDFGLYDMAGNVEEWLWDSSSVSAISDTLRYLSGGSYIGDKEICYPGRLSRLEPNKRYDSIGFRIVCLTKTVTARKEEISQTKIPDELELEMIKIPGKNLCVLKTEVTQKLYLKITGTNPSINKGNDKPVEYVSWYDAIYFCNKLSVLKGKTPVYALDGNTDVAKWDYRPNKGEPLYGNSLTQNLKASGYRLPTMIEWEYAAKGGEDYIYSGSNDIDEVAWHYLTSRDKPQKVGSKKANKYGLHDMTGNVWEWCWESDGTKMHYARGGSCFWEFSTEISSFKKEMDCYRNCSIGFRIVCLADDSLEPSSYKPERKPDIINIDMVSITEKKYAISKTEITQKIYEEIMGENPSKFTFSSELPVEQVSWYDAIYFCNKLSVANNRNPVYSINGKSDVSKWNYIPHKGNSIEGEITQNLKADGYRLPTMEEWEYAAKGNFNYIYSGSNNIDEVAWYYDNSDSSTHPVAQKKANRFGLYDMSGNVWEWCWDIVGINNRFVRGGSWRHKEDDNKIDFQRNFNAASQNSGRGFRVVLPLD